MYACINVCVPFVAVGATSSSRAASITTAERNADPASRETGTRMCSLKWW